MTGTFYGCPLLSKIWYWADAVLHGKISGLSFSLFVVLEMMTKGSRYSWKLTTRSHIITATLPILPLACIKLKENFGDKTYNHSKTMLKYMKIKFSIKDFRSKCEQIHRKLRIWSHLLKKPYWKTSFFVKCKVHEKQT